MIAIISSFVICSLVLHVLVLAKWTVPASRAITITTGHYPWRDVISEAEEFVEALEQGDWEGVWEEWSDLCFTFFVKLYQITSVPFPILFGRPCYEKGIKRHQVWREIFTQHNLLFSPRYLRGGSNYLKKAKVEAALKMAMEEQKVQLRLDHPYIKRVCGW